MIGHFERLMRIRILVCADFDFAMRVFCDAGRFVVEVFPTPEEPSPWESQIKMIFKGGPNWVLLGVMGKPL